jgi:hypothetical protein
MSSTRKILGITLSKVVTYFELMLASSGNPRQANHDEIKEITEMIEVEAKYQRTSITFEALNFLL